ncbi:MAG TPA: tripartite tricarboxylate transporter permease, partial [Gemmatimonadales bacterium]|nr:tripartite tricarboxylate transporter permease [Gemmatimonadales bacterium]
HRVETLGPLLQGFSVALEPFNLALAFGGVLVGTVVGMLPGIGPINAIAVLIPITFAVRLAPESALILFAGIYYGAQYGNSISTILLNVPGDSASIATTFDGYAMARAGRASTALATAAVASFVGGTLSIFGLVLLAPVLARWAIRFGPAEYFALMVFAFAALSGLAGKAPRKALAATGLGLMLATVGLDPFSGVPRYTFGEIKLLDGLDFVVVTIGLFAVSEVLVLLESSRSGQTAMAAVGRVMESIRETGVAAWSMVRGSAVGFVVGVLPGAGGTIAALLAYTSEKRLVDRAGTFGTGDIRGVAAPEAANNAAATGAMIPLLTLGVPGSGTTAVMLGALLGMNVRPGPLMMQDHPEVFWGLAASMYIGNLILLVLNLPLVGLFASMLRLPRWVLFPAVTALAFVSVYAVNASALDLVLMTAFGVLGYVMRKLEYPLAPLVLGLVLGPLAETSLRRSLALSGGDWGVLFSSPIAVGLWVMAAGLAVVPAWLGSKGRSVLGAA